jgi:hypothetical protein
MQRQPPLESLPLLLMIDRVSLVNQESRPATDISRKDSPELGWTPLIG